MKILLEEKTETDNRGGLQKKAARKLLHEEYFVWRIFDVEITKNS